jgi:hypothetical protein
LRKGGDWTDGSGSVGGGKYVQRSEDVKAFDEQQNEFAQDREKCKGVPVVVAVVVVEVA